MCMSQIGNGIRMRLGTKRTGENQMTGDGSVALSCRDDRTVMAGTQIRQIPEPGAADPADRAAAVPAQKRQGYVTEPQEAVHMQEIHETQKKQMYKKLHTKET